MKVIGHRGARGLAPENTLEALMKAMQFKVDAVEFDVRVTKDSVPVLSHNPYIVGSINETFLIAHHTYDELAKVKPDLATFEEAITAVNRRVQLLVEVKPGVPIKPVIKVIKHYLSKGWRPDDFLLGSFNQSILQELHEALPAVELVVIERWSGVRAVRRAKQVGSKCLSMNHLWLWRGVILALNRGGYELYAYTLNDPAKAKRWSRFGLAGVITDFPDRFS